jgi:hypothetical protein
MNPRFPVLLFWALCISGGVTTCFAPGSNENRVSIPKPGIDGRVVQVDEIGTSSGESSLLGAILVEGTMQDGTPNARVSVSITKDTRLQQQDGQSRRNITIGSLKVGQRVQVTFRGPIAESFPMQASADEIVVIP